MRKNSPSASKPSIPKRGQRLKARDDEESTHLQAHEIVIESLQQEKIPNNESRASSEAITKDEITNNEPSTEEELPFPPITRHNFYKHPIFLARFLGYAIPLCFLLYVLYINYLPFGYHKKFTIEVGALGDMKASELYLEPSKGLSERKKAEDGSTYRELNGVGKATFKPKTVLRDASLTISTNDPGISFIPPYVDFNPEEIDWDLHWDLTKEVPKDLINTNVFYFEGEPYFDGTSRLEMASSSHLFEDGPFTVYAEWKPKNLENDFQQIVGHYNWEVLQNKNTVKLMIGRVNNNDGQFYSANYTIPDPVAFVKQRHTLLAIYNPDPVGGNGYIEIYVDGYFGARTNIGKDIIWKDYNGKKNLTSGKSDHGSAFYYEGSIYDIRLRTRNFLKTYKTIYLDFSNEKRSSIQIPFTSQSTSTFKHIEIHVDQR